MNNPALALALEHLASAVPSRRERIATACLQGILADPSVIDDAAVKVAMVAMAVEWADALIAELDKEPSK